MKQILDDIIIVENITQQDLEKDLSDLAEIYSEEVPDRDEWNNLLFEVQLSSTSNQSFALTFPSGIELEVFCHIVNFLRYPFRKHSDKSISNGYRVVTFKDGRLPSELIGKRCQFFCDGNSEEDAFTEYIVTEENKTYELDLESSALKAKPSSEECKYDIIKIHKDQLKTIKIFKADKSIPQQNHEQNIKTYQFYGRVFIAASIIVVLLLLLFFKVKINGIYLIYYCGGFFFFFPQVFGRLLHNDSLFKEWIGFTVLLFIASIYVDASEITILSHTPLQILRLPLVSVVSTRIYQYYYFKKYNRYLHLGERGVYQAMFMMITIAIGAVVMFY